LNEFVELSDLDLATNARIVMKPGKYSEQCGSHSPMLYAQW